MKVIIKMILIMITVLCGFCFAEEEVSPRRMYQDGFQQMQKASAFLIYEEGKSRQNHFGFGVSGVFLEDFENWTLSNLNDGFINIELNYCIDPFLYAEIGGGCHSTSDRTVFPVYAALQLVLPAVTTLEETPSSAGISIGFINYSSSNSIESVTCFKIGLVSYRFFNKNSAWETSIEWITPDFRNNNLVIKTGPKLFWL